jgi:hypothetical protein
MGNQRPARQIKGYPPHALVLGDTRYGSGHIDERDIAYGKLHTSIILVDRRSAGDLKHSLVMVPIVEANIPVRALEPVGVATDIHCRQSAYTQTAQPTRKGVGIYAH